MSQALTTAPVLSTPETHILAEDIPAAARQPAEILSDEQIHTRYEISRTIQEIKQKKWKRVALQFPDQMLTHSARVYQLLARGLKSTTSTDDSHTAETGTASEDFEISRLSLGDVEPVKLTILGDTSYGSCCVDEIAAEHVDADAVVHYGRACLSPTARLPVLHIFTVSDLDYGRALASFRNHFPDIDTKVILTADVPYATHIVPVVQLLKEVGYTDIFAASIIHDPSSSIPNRTVPATVSADPSSLAQWHLFHISDPPTSLLLSLISRVSSIKIFPTEAASSTSASSSATAASNTQTQMLLRRRYALITSLTTASTWGILINTLSVKNYLSILSHIQRLIADAGRKSYLFVVGKLNTAKIANFSEIGGWVVIGCWESSLIDSREFYRPIITPFELELVLKRDDERVWTGQWRGDFQGVLEQSERAKEMNSGETNGKVEGSDENNILNGAGRRASEGDETEESDSEPPEFDLRTGRYISRTRPMQSTRGIRNGGTATSASPTSTALTKRNNKGDLVAINGIASPAAEYLAQKRTWKGLGSDFELKYEEREDMGNTIEEGRTGVARGYTVGESSKA